ncbi:hypothetical protein METP3_02285 [Methanosarcinales archaeon]|nr:hypothetical protein METP3_02285 [Methanosarcinales archaeon]
MSRNIVLIIGILATIMVFGAAVALARNTSENKNDTEDLECTPEMMGNEKVAVENTSTIGESHCGDMDSDMGSMMSSRGTGMKGMM